MLKGSQTPIRLRDLSLEAHQRFLGFGLAPKSFLLFPSPYRGRHYWVPSTQRLFGGQIVGQALVAAAKSVSEDVHVHSLHCYFVRTGKPPPPYPTPALVAQQPLPRLGEEEGERWRVGAREWDALGSLERNKA